MSRRSLLALVVAVAGLALPVSAGAQITIGQNGLLADLEECNYTDGRDYAQQAVTSGAKYTVPTAGVLTSWSTVSELTGSLALKVFRPVAGQYLVLAQDGPKNLPASLPQTYQVSIPVLPGDLVGLAAPPFAGSGCRFKTGSFSNSVKYQLKNAPPGATIPLSSGSDLGPRLNISATLLPPPTIAALSPASGSVTGATTAITGTNFASVNAVSFGGVPAPAFTVDSEGQITATVPPGTALGAVPLTVTTAAGSATASFSYVGCKVPKLAGKKLKAARKAVRKAGCKLGKVTKRGGATGKTGRVTKQGPKAGKLLAPGTKVKVTLKP